MDEFIENFNAFRDWLYEQDDRADVGIAEETIREVKDKFEELHLNDVF